MTTPASYAFLIKDIRARFEEATKDLEKNARNLPPLSEGYAIGYRDALGELLENITGETVTPHNRSTSEVSS